MFEPFAQEIIHLSNLKLSDRMLDVACGTGIVSRLATSYLGAAGGKVVGVDINPTMLKMASTFAKTIEWVEGSATSLPFSNESFDLVICQQGLQFFPDRLLALKEMNRVLAGGGAGRLVLSVLVSIKDSPSFDTLERLLKTIFGTEASTIMRMPYLLSDPSELLAIVRAGGFDDLEIRDITKTASFPSTPEFIYAFSRGSMLSSYFSRISESEYGKLLRHAEQELSPFNSERDDGNSRNRRISFPIKSWIVIARKKQEVLRQ